MSTTILAPSRIASGADVSFGGSNALSDFRKLFDFSDQSIGHLCQSRYAAEFVKKQGILDFLFLSDCLNEDFLTSHAELSRDDRVLYNPSKGFWFTKKIIDANPDIDFVAIEGMTPAQTKSLMRTSKLYIDFGDHPGKDRLPREAAICGCCIVLAATVRRPITKTFQSRTNTRSNVRMSCCRRSQLPFVRRSPIMNDCIDDFRHYVQKINQEPAVFAKQVMDFISTVDLTRVRHGENVRSREFQD